MSISSPLPSTTFSSKPLQLTLSLDGFPVPQNQISSSSSSEGEEDTSTSDSDGEDILDELDRSRPSIGGYYRSRDSGSRKAEKRRKQDQVVSDVLADRSKRLYPTTDLPLERLVNASRGGELPDWLRETSGKVTSIAVGQVYKEETVQSEEDEQERRKTKRTRRVAVGSEDGVIWMFRDRGETPRTIRKHARDATVVTSLPSPPRTAESDKTRPHRPSPTVSRPSSPRSSLSQAFSPPPGSSLSPRLTTRRSSASLSTLSSLTSQSAGRNISGPPSLNGSTTTYSELRSLPDQRLRKASATVSVSTTSVTPAPSHRHSHSQSRETSSPAVEQDATDSSSFSLPPLSPVEHSTYPLSPIPTHPPPQFSFSPSTPSNDSETASNRITPSPRILHSGLSSKKEQQSRNLESRNRSHSRGLKKESITNGIGLWETSGSTADLSIKDGLGIMNGSGEEEHDKEEEEEEEEENWEKSDLEPVLKVLTPGFGRVCGLEIVREDRVPCSGYQKGQEAGVVLLVLRQSGHLSVISLSDGRCLGSCEAGRGNFESMQVVERDSTTVALCALNGSVVCVDLETLSIASTVEGIDLFAVSNSLAPTSTLIYTAPDSKQLFSTSIPSSPGRTSLGTLETWDRMKGLKTNGKLVVAWDETGLSVAGLDQGQFSQIALLPCSEVQDVLMLPGSERFLVQTSADLQIYKLDHREIKLQAQYTTGRVEQLHLIKSSCSSFEFLCVQVDENADRSIVYLKLDSGLNTRTLYRSLPNPYHAQITRSRKLDSQTVLVGYSNGGISRLPISSLGKETRAIDIKLNGAISVLDVIDLGAREIVVAGTVSGSVGCWNLSDWEEIAGFSLFASPVLAYAKLSLPSHPHSLLFVSSNSPIALVSLHPPELLFTLPGSRTPAQLVATTKLGEVMVLYKQGLARVWDAETGELRRSMDQKTAESVLKEKEKAWRIWFDADVESAGTASSSMSHPSITFDLRTALDEVSRDLPWSLAKQRTPRKLLNGFDSLDATPDISRSTSPAVFASTNNFHTDHLEIVKTWLSNLIAFGIDKDCDHALEQLEISAPNVQLSLASHQPRSLAFSTRPLSKSAWTISPHSTAQRLLLITCLLRVFLNYPSTERVASEVIVHFSACLEASVAGEFQRPSLEFFANYWLDKNPEVQQAAKTLFGTYLGSLSNDDTLALVKEWEGFLPARQVSRGSPHSKADTAILLVGLVAVDRFKLLSAYVLTDLSKSIASYLEEPQHAFHQALATELCSRGFHIWQNYVDAMTLVRQLFSIAIGRNPSTPSDLRAMARQATVHVASVNSPLFMSTLLFDILNAPTVVSRNSTLKLLGFMIRKKPLVLYHSLPRVVEAVVKSLDPTMGDLRETVQQTATVILNELVRTFPSIDFHGKSQRLAVGTQEGSAIVYDLKTATRLYVLEGHRRPITAVSWSLDGHRLATISLDENKVCIWKTGMGILSLIGAPTQRAGSPPFKEWDFHVGDEALMTTAATLEWVVVDWPAERTVRLRIRETTLSFGA
ncbi:hypothetical protein JCM3765_005885 [Sporobolomyces pararoseus]